MPILQRIASKLRRVTLYLNPDKFNEAVGAATLLWMALGDTQNPGELRKIRNAGLIYGDSITKERAFQILDRAYDRELSPYNFVFGIGSYTYQYVTRDTYNFAFKATAVQRENGVVEAIFKAPVTDTSHKKSHVGIPIAARDNVDGNIRTIQTINPELLNARNIDISDGYTNVFEKVFNGTLLVDQNFFDIRKRVREQA